MTLQIIRKNGRIQGVAFLLGKARILVMGEKERELWRVCELCSVDEAIVFCRTHTKYICGRCLTQLPSVHRGCEFISVQVARDIATQAQRWAEVQG